MNILVSINCLTYNHEKYIDYAIESFLMQKTNFNFEVLIHDDASTDKTADIIREYQNKYPEIIKPIFQKENKYSCGNKRIDYNYNHTRAKGKYIALCEGDDYWTDPYKLQRQVDYLEQNSDCTLCFHNAYVLDEKYVNRKRLFIPWKKQNEKYFFRQNRKYTAGELQLLGFIPTASFMFPKYVLDDPPQWYFEAPVGDTPMKLIAASFGYAYYIDEPMSIYRFNVPNSATTKWQYSSRNSEIKQCIDFIQMMDAFNNWTNHKYDSEIDEAKKTWEFQLAISKNIGEFKNERYKELYNRLSIRRKINLHARYFLPNTYTKLSDIKRYIKEKIYLNGSGEG